MYGGGAIDLESIDHINSPGIYTISGTCMSGSEEHYIKLVCEDIIYYTTCENNSFSVDSVNFTNLPSRCFAEIFVQDYRKFAIL